jgi:tRNA pseudouridine55 synthase
VIGVLPLDKPVGPTSHDLVGWTRRALGMKRVGHAGTLDPFASGLLLVCVGQATRLVEYLHFLDKSYEAEAVLGEVTTTDDPEGPVVARSQAWEGLSEDAVAEALSRQVGTFLQRPPAFSAKKVDGETAYRMAREGRAPELEPVPVTVHEVELLAMELPRVRFRVRCGTGTYIRAMARDLGEALGCGAHLSALRRTRIGSFSVEDAVNALALQPGAAEDRQALQATLEAALVSPAGATGHLPAIGVGPEAEARLRMGQRVELSSLAPTRDLPEGEPLAMVAQATGELVGVGEREGSLLRPRKVLPVESPTGGGR